MGLLRSTGTGFLRLPHARDLDKRTAVAIFADRKAEFESRAKSQRQPQDEDVIYGSDTREILPYYRAVHAEMRFADERAGGESRSMEVLESYYASADRGQEYDTVLHVAEMDLSVAAALILVLQSELLRRAYVSEPKERVDSAKDRLIRQAEFDAEIAYNASGDSGFRSPKQTGPEDSPDNMITREQKPSG